MKKKVILGYPYANSLYWLTGRENPNSWYYKEKRYPGGHSYYERLYGNHSQENINNAISLSLLFDDVILIAADAYFPNLKSTDGKFRVDQGLGIKIYSDWDKMQEFRIREEEVDIFLKDKDIAGLIGKNDKYTIYAIINEIILQNYLANEYNAVILGGEKHLFLSKKVLNILNKKPKVDDKDLSLKNYLEGVNDIFQLQGINYKINEYDDFAYLKENKAIIKYANSFKDRLDEILRGEKYNEKELIESILEVFETNETKSYIAKGLGITATVAGILSLVALYSNPITATIGTVAGVSGVGTDISSRIVDKLKKDNWLKLVPEINNTLTHKRLLDRYKELEKNEN